MPCSADMEISRSMLLDGIDIQRGHNPDYSTEKALSPPRTRATNAYVEMTYPSSAERKSSPVKRINGLVNVGEHSQTHSEKPTSPRKEANTNDSVKSDVPQGRVRDQHKHYAVSAENSPHYRTGGAEVRPQTDLTNWSSPTALRPASLGIKHSSTEIESQRNLSNVWRRVNSPNRHRASHISIPQDGEAGYTAQSATPPGNHNSMRSSNKHIGTGAYQHDARRALRFGGIDLDLDHRGNEIYENGHLATMRRHRGMYSKTRHVSRSLDDLDLNGDDDDDDDDSYVELDAKDGVMTPPSYDEVHHNNHSMGRQLSAPPASQGLILHHVNKDKDINHSEDPNTSHYIDMNQCRLLTKTHKSPGVMQHVTSANDGFNNNKNDYKSSPSRNGGFEQNGFHGRRRDGPLSRSYESILSDHCGVTNWNGLRNSYDNSCSIPKSPAKVQSVTEGGLLRHTQGANNYVHLTDSVLPAMGSGERQNHISDFAREYYRDENQTCTRRFTNNEMVSQHLNYHTNKSKHVTSRSNTLPHPPKHDLYNIQNNTSPQPQNHCHSEIYREFHTSPKSVKNPQQIRRPYLHSRAWSDDIQLRSPSPIPEDETVLCKSAPQPNRFHPIKTIGSNNTPLTHYQNNTTHHHHNHDLMSTSVLSRVSQSEEILPKYRSSNSTTDDSDENDDDYGFLTFSHGSPFLSSAMQKAKSPSSSSPSSSQQQQQHAAIHKTLTKKWRRANKTTHKVRSSLWTPEGSCTWKSVTNQRVSLTSSSLLGLSEVERVSLQKIAYDKLQSCDLQAPVVIPKDPTQKRSKRGTFSLKRKSNYAGLFENFSKDKGKEKNGREGSFVFGIPLVKCIANDLELQRNSRSSLLKERRESFDLTQHAKPRSLSKSSSSSGHHSSESLSESDGGKTSIIDALSLTSSMKLETQEWSLGLNPSASPLVPYLVNTCCKHLETYGLRTLGIFRIGSSKKRIKQLREEFDSGKDVKLNEEHNPHDVGALLKEYFRDLPDPLLTRELYPAFVASRKIENVEKRLQALHLLLALLPTANRDTWWSLLKFLSLVAQHSTDTVDENGQDLPGNKMDAHNLATLFGPNVLHTARPGVNEDFQVETAERANERKEVIAVIEEMIHQHVHLFELSSEEHHEILKTLMTTNTEAVDYLLWKKSEKPSKTDADLESSSNLFEGSDSSSIPRSPNSDTDLLFSHHHPRTLNEALHLQQTHQNKTLLRVHSCDSGQNATSLQIPDVIIHRVNQSSWNQQESSPFRSKMSAGHLKVSHSKSLDSNMGQMNRYSRSRSRESDANIGSSIPHHPHESSSSLPGHMTHLRVPSVDYSMAESYPDSQSSVSNSSSHSSGHHGSARSSWFLAVPSGDINTSSHHDNHPPHEVSSPRTNHSHHTSSTQRPLGVGMPHLSDRTLDQREKWKQWQQYAAELSEDSQEPQTLV